MPKEWYNPPEEISESCLSDVLTEEALRTMAGSRAFTNGRGYFEQGQVGDLVQVQETLAATVTGNDVYQVRLFVSGGKLGHDCTCPVGSDGKFCKHCVAAGLAWLTVLRSAAPVLSLDHVRSHLESLDKAELARMLLDQALSDTALRQRLLLQAAQNSTDGPDLDALRGAIHRAAATGDYVEYDEVPRYARGLRQITSAIKEVLESGHALAAMDLAEYAVLEIEEAVEGIDDSDGDVLGILNDLSAIHLEAALSGATDSKTLGRRLFRLNTASDYLDFDVHEYDLALDEEGLQEYRRAAEEAWNAPSSARSGKSGGALRISRYKLERIMLTLAEEAGDIEASVRILSRDLSTPERFFDVARVYESAGQIDTALSWAERGVKAFPAQAHFSLHGLLVVLYAKAGRHDDALKILWRDFESEPSFRSYRALHDYTQRIERWNAWRDKAWKVLRQKPVASRASPWAALLNRDHSLRVQILLWEDRVDEAWEDAQAGGCSPALWLALADRREADHPEDTLAVYQARIVPLIEPVSNGRYEQPVEYLVKVASLLHRLDRGQEFDLYLENLRETYKRKRNFIKLLDHTFH